MTPEQAIDNLTETGLAAIKLYCRKCGKRLSGKKIKEAYTLKEGKYTYEIYWKCSKVRWWENGHTEIESDQQGVY